MKLFLSGQKDGILTRDFSALGQTSFGRRLLFWPWFAALRLQRFVNESDFSMNLPQVEWEQERREAQYISLHDLISLLQQCIALQCANKTSSKS